MCSIRDNATGNLRGFIERIRMAVVESVDASRGMRKNLHF